MELQSLFTVLVLLIHIVQSLLQSSFFGEVEADQLLYAAIRVPSHVTYHEVILWAEESTLHPIALLRYDGLPTMEIYDLKTSIPSLTATLKLLDKSPTQSTLYIGVYGGSKLHRYHYFAGSPTTVLFAVESNMNVCRNEMQRGANCTFVDKVGSNTIGQTTASLLQFGIRSQFTLTVPSNLEGVQVGTRIANFRNALCGWIQADTDSNILIIRTEAYFDHPDEELNSGRRVQYVNFTDLCDFQSSSSYDNVDLSLFIKRPLAGVWTYSIYIGWKSSQSTHIAGPNSRRLTNKSSATSEFTRLVPHDNIEKRSDLMGKGINVTSNGLIVPITITSKLLSCPLGYTVNVDLSGFSAEHFNTSFCTARMVSMFSLRTPMIAEGFFAMHGAATLLRSMDVVTKPPLATQSQNQQEEPKIAKTAITNVDQQASPFVVFAASITPPVQELAVGGGMVMQLRVQLPVDAEHVSNEQFAQLMDRLHFQVAVRLGGLPQDPSFYPSVAGGSGGDSSSDEWDVQSLNAFLLSTRDRAAVVDESTTRNQKADDDDDDDDDGVASSQFTSRKESCRSGVGCKRANLAQGRNGVQSLTHVRTYSWVITRPALPALHSSPLGADGVENLFIRISREPLDLPAAAAGADIPSQNNGTRSGNQRPFGVLHTPPVRTSSSAYWSRKTKDTVKRGADLEQGQEEAGEGERGGFASVSWPEDLLVSVSLTFEPCPRGSCVHGTCYTQSGDIAAYSCACRYPWAGESCDTLSVSFSFYLVQIFLLVLSNAAMIPAIACCRVGNLSFLAALLSLSAGSSAFYHLCDTDVYCIAGLSFRSLQILDVLFSVSAIASVLLLYAPISRSTHSALSLLCLGLLVAPVSNLPTSPMNVLQAATFSLTVVLAGWLFKSGGCSATICGVDFRPVFQCFVTTTGADPLSWEQGAHGTDIKLDRRGDAIQNGVGKRGNVRNAPGSASSSIYNTLRTGQLPQSEIAIQVGAIEDDDLEMTTSSHSLQPQMTNTPQEFAAENDSGGSFQDETFSIHQSMLFGALLALRSRKLRMPLCGMVLGMTGLLCFALQGRDTYYFLHSLWHFLMMISAYLLVHGRIELLDL